MGPLNRALRGESIPGHVLWILGLFAVLGLLGAGLWVWLWTPAEGVVVNGQLVVVGDGQRQAFDSTGWFLLVSAPAGLVAGLLVGLVSRRNELTTLAGLLVGAVMAALLMRWLGNAWGPADPAPLAATSEDLASLPLALDLPGLIPALALPTGALTGLLAAFVLSPTRRTASRRQAEVVSTIPS